MRDIAFPIFALVAAFLVGITIGATVSFYKNAENYLCTTGEPVEVDWAIDAREFIDGQGRRSFVYDRVPIYECRLPEAPDASD